MNKPNTPNSSGKKQATVALGVHPLTVSQPQWQCEEEPLVTTGLWVQHHCTPPGEVEHPPFNHHLLTISFNHQTQQWCRFGGCEYRGPRAKEQFLLLPMCHPSAFSWNGCDEAIVWLIEPGWLDQVANETDGFPSHRVELIPTLMGQDINLATIAHLFRQEIHQNGPGEEFYRESLANLLALHLLRHHCTFKACPKTYQGGLSPSHLKRAIAYIQANMDHQLKLKDIALELNLSLYHFCKLFKQSMGIPPYHYVLQQRVEHAQQLLKNPELTIADIAYQCGFAHQTHLTRHFRKLVGKTPKEYRASIH